MSESRHKEVAARKVGKGKGKSTSATPREESFVEEGGEADNSAGVDVEDDATRGGNHQADQESAGEGPSGRGAQHAPKTNKRPLRQSSRGSTSASDEEQPPKKQRGRPRKQVADPKPAPGPKRPRGRPRKDGRMPGTHNNATAMGSSSRRDQDLPRVAATDTTSNATYNQDERGQDQSVVADADDTDDEATVLPDDNEPVPSPTQRPTEQSNVEEAIFESGNHRDPSDDTNEASSSRSAATYTDAAVDSGQGGDETSSNLGRDSLLLMNTLDAVPGRAIPIRPRDDERRNILEEPQPAAVAPIAATRTDREIPTGPRADIRRGFQSFGRGNGQFRANGPVPGFVQGRNRSFTRGRGHGPAQGHSQRLAQGGSRGRNNSHGRGQGQGPVRNPRGGISGTRGRSNMLGQGGRGNGAHSNGSGSGRSEDANFAFPLIGPHPTDEQFQDFLANAFGGRLGDMLGLSESDLENWRSNRLLD